MRVSIILPVYNVAPYLRGCLDSIGGQTYRDFEVIAVDDGSTDSSGRILDDYRAAFPLRCIHQKNAGLSAARNAAMAVAGGDYVLMVDSDDCIHPRLLELAVEAMESGDLDFVMFDCLRTEEADVPRVLADWAEDRVAVTAKSLPVPAFDWFVNHSKRPCVWQFLFRRRSLANRTFVPGILYEDVPFVLGYLSGGVRGACLQKALYCYSIVSGSITGQKSQTKRMEGLLVGLRLVRREIAESQYRLFARRQLSFWMRDLWRKVRASSADGAKESGAYAAFLRTAFGERLLRWDDFGWRWRIRLWWVMWQDGGERT